jgi:hypothetical protein
MKRFKLLGLTLLAAFALGAVLVASASAALPELLPVKTGGSSFTGKNTAANPTLETLKKESIVCSAATADGVQETDTSGTYHIHFTGCKGFGFANCNTEGDESGVILTLGGFSYVDDHLSVNVSELGVAILFNANATIKCTALATIKVEGKVVCLVLEPLSSKVTHEFHCTQTSGMQSETHWWNDAGTEQTSVLLSSKNGGAFEESGEQALGSVTFAEAVAFMNE